MNRRNFVGRIGAAIAGLVLGGNVKASGGGVEFADFGSDFRSLTLDNAGIRLYDGTHALERRVTIGDLSGFTIENRDSGDAILQFELDTAKRWTVGIDDDNSDRYKIPVDVDGDDWYGAWL
jgi:hypothetical protein